MKTNRKTSASNYTSDTFSPATKYLIAPPLYLANLYKSLFLAPVHAIFNSLAGVVSTMRRKEKTPKQKKTRFYLYNAWYAFTGRLRNTPPSPQIGEHLSLKSLDEKTKWTVGLGLGLLIAAQVCYNVALYMTLYAKKYLLDSFVASNTPLFYFYLKYMVIISLFTLTLRTILKWLRKTLQAKWSKALSKKWIDTITNKADLQDLPEQTRNMMGQILEDELDSAISYAVLNLVQTVYMSIDMCVYAGTLIIYSPALFFFGIFIVLSAYTLLDIPKSFQFHFQTKDRTLRTNQRNETNNYVKRIPLVTSVHSTPHEKKALNSMINNRYDNYSAKISWEASFSFFKKLFLYLSYPVVLLFLYRPFTLGTITFGTAMLLMDYFKSFVRTIMLINDNYKMFNKQSITTDRIFLAQNAINKSIQHVQKRKEKFYRKSREDSSKITFSNRQSLFTSNKGNRQNFIPDFKELNEGIYVLDGESGTGKSLFTQAMSATLHLENKIESHQPITLPQVLYDGKTIVKEKIYSINQTASSLSLEGEESMSIEQIIKYPDNLMQNVTDETRNKVMRYFQGTSNHGITNFENQNIHEPNTVLSAGQKQVLHLARLLILFEHHKQNKEAFPFKMLILDEIDSNLDKTNKVGMYRLLLEYVREYKDAGHLPFTFIVTHDDDIKELLTSFSTVDDEQKKELSSLANACGIKTINFSKDNGNTSINLK